MDGFNTYLAFYGLLLGLSVAEVASGSLNAIGARQSIKIGWLTPALAVFLLLDITSFWIYAWNIRSGLTVTWGSMFGALFMAMGYYLAAGLVFPRQISEWPDLDDHYWRHKRWVYGGLLTVNLIAVAHAYSITTPKMVPAWWIGQLMYWPPLVALLFTRNARLDLVMLAIIIVGYVFIPVFPETGSFN